MALSAGTIMATLALSTSPFKASLQSAQNDLKTFANGSESTGKRITALGSAANTVGASLAKHVTLPIVGVGAAAIKMSSDFDAQMSRVQSVAGASGSQMETLRKQAIDLGASTSFSASEAAEGMENLASAGFSVNEITSAMPGMMNLAAASGEDLATSSDIAATTLRGFGLAASQAGHVADVLAKNANATNASVASTGEAMKYVAPIAHTAGMSMEEVTAAIGEMANQGIQGSQAGTTLRSALNSLSNPSKQAAGLMKQIGFSAFDTNGKMLPLNEIIGKLQSSTKGMTQQQKALTLSTIFGSDALSGMQVLIGDGQDKLKGLTKELKNSDGAAKAAAKTNQDNLKGSIEGLKGSLESAATAIGKTMTPAIRSITDHLGNLVKAFNRMSPASQTFIVAVGGVVAAIGPALLIFAKTVKAMQSIHQAFTIVKDVKAVSTAISGIGKAFNVLTLGANPVMIAIYGIAIAALIIYKNWDKLAPYFKKVWAVVTGIFTSAKNTIMSAWSGITGFFSGIWNGIKSGVHVAIAGISTGWTAAVTGIKTAFSAIGNFFAGVWNGIKAVSLAIWNAMKVAGLAVWNGLVGGIKSIWNGLVAFFKAFPGVMANIGKSIFNFFKNGAISLLTNAVAGIKALWNGVVNFFRSMPTVFANTGRNIFSFFKNGAISLLTGAVAGIKKMWNGLVNWFKNFPKNFVNIGKDIMQGLWNGLKAIGGKVVAFAKKLAKDLLTGMKKVFGIASPSKQTYAMGGYLIKGLENALLSGAGHIKAVVQKVFGGAINFAHGIVGSAKVGAWLTTALAQSGKPLAWLPALQTLVQKESGGNPLSVNSQAVGGEHATGLMQMLGSTFNSYAASGHGNIMNPIDNIMSALNYIKARYGSPYNIPHLFSGNYVGYATGTNNATPGAHAVGEKGLEVVLGNALKWFRGGETVLSNMQTNNLVTNMTSVLNTLQGLVTGVQAGVSGISNVFENANNVIGDNNLNLVKKAQDSLNTTGGTPAKVELHLDGKYAFTDRESIDYLSTEISRKINGNVRRRK